MEGGTQAAGNRWRFAGKEEQKTGITLDWLNFGARMYDPCLGRWTTQDPLAEKYPGTSPYVYCAGDPVNLVDPDGKFPETIWDIANVVLDVGSLIDNIKNGNVKGALIDGGGLVLDVSAAFLPFVPGGAGTAIKAGRTGDKVVNVLKATDSISHTGKATSSRAARREVMRKAGIPTSMQPKSQVKNQSGRAYNYEMNTSYGGKEIKSVQQQTLDSSHPDKPHWEAGTIKDNNENNHYGFPRIQNRGKQKVVY